MHLLHRLVGCRLNRFTTTQPSDIAVDKLVGLHEYCDQDGRVHAGCIDLIVAPDTPTARDLVSYALVRHREITGEG